MAGNPCGKLREQKTMTSFTMPLEERLDCHPVHQATAIPHRAMLSPVISPDPAEIWDDHALRFSPAPTGLGDSPAGVTYTATLSALLGLPATKDRDISCQPPVALQPYVSAATAPLEEISEENETLDETTEAQLQTLVQAFHQRQQQASLIVACSVVAAIVLTFGGLALLFNLTGPETAARQDASVDGPDRAASRDQTRDPRTCQHGRTPSHPRHPGATPRARAASPSRARTLFAAARAAGGSRVVRRTPDRTQHVDGERRGRVEPHAHPR
jgi:hypothetical protein